MSIDRSATDNEKVLRVRSQHYSNSIQSSIVCVCVRWDGVRCGTTKHSGEWKSLRQADSLLSTTDILQWMKPHVFVQSFPWHSHCYRFAIALLEWVQLTSLRLNYHMNLVCSKRRYQSSFYSYFRNGAIFPYFDKQKSTVFCLWWAWQHYPIEWCEQKKATTTERDKLAERNKCLLKKTWILSLTISHSPTVEKKVYPPLMQFVFFFSWIWQCK